MIGAEVLSALAADDLDQLIGKVAGAGAGLMAEVVSLVGEADRRELWRSDGCVRLSWEKVVAVVDIVEDPAEEPFWVDNAMGCTMEYLEAVARRRRRDRRNRDVDASAAAGEELDLASHVVGSVWLCRFPLRLHATTQG